MLIIDGVRYEEWIPESEEEFEEIIKEHAKDIFGEDSIYFDLKKKLKTRAGIGSIPDGYVISLQEEPCWYICEVEFHTHPLYEHIIAQLQKIITGAKTLQSQNVVRDAIYSEITGDPFKEALIKSKIGTEDPHHFISNLISKPPILVIPIDQKIDGLEEACDGLPIEKVRIVEFKTFTREGVGLSVHAHSFPPLYEVEKRKEESEGKEEKWRDKTGRGGRIGKKVTFSELVGAGLLKWGQALYFYNTRLFTDECARVMPSNQLRYEVDGKSYSKSELAKILLIKHDFKHDEHGVAGPKYWKTDDGKSLRELEEQIRSLRGDRG